MTKFKAVGQTELLSCKTLKIILMHTLDFLLQVLIRK